MFVLKEMNLLLNTGDIYGPNLSSNFNNLHTLDTLDALPILLKT